MKSRLKTLFALHLLLIIYSLSGVISKLAAGLPFLSLEFCGMYAALISILAFYAFGWQQILKRLPLTTAFSSKAVTIIWGIIWGCLFFSEAITFGKVVGAILIVTGVILFSYADAGASTELTIDKASADE